MKENLLWEIVNSIPDIFLLFYYILLSLEKKQPARTKTFSSFLFSTSKIVTFPCLPFNTNSVSNRRFADKQH